MARKLIRGSGRAHNINNSDKVAKFRLALLIKYASVGISTHFVNVFQM